MLGLVEHSGRPPGGPLFFALVTRGLGIVFVPIDSWIDVKWQVPFNGRIGHGLRGYWHCANAH